MIRTAPAICLTGITVRIKEAWGTRCCRHPGMLPSRSSFTSARMRTREESSEHHESKRQIINSENCGTDIRADLRTARGFLKLFYCSIISTLIFFSVAFFVYLLCKHSIIIYICVIKSIIIPKMFVLVIYYLQSHLQMSFKRSTEAFVTSHWCDLP